MVPTIEQIKPIISRRAQGTITSIAIAVNLLFITLLLFAQLNFDNNSLVHHLRKTRAITHKRHSKEKWAPLSLKAGQTHAPVILINASQPPKPNSAPQAPAFTPAPQSTGTTPAYTTHEQIQKTEPTRFAEEKSIDTQENQHTEIKNNASLEHAIKAALARKLKDSARQTIEKSKVSKQDKPMPQQATTTINPHISSAILKPFSISQKMANRPAHQFSRTARANRSTQPNKNSVPTNIPQIQKPKLTFAQLVKGFTEHLKTEGEYTIAMQGNSDTKATEQQLRVGRFLQKIIQCLQTAWKVNRIRYPLNHRVFANVAFRIVINKNGSLDNLIIHRTSGRQIIDKFIFDVIKDASKSFPSIPHYLKQDVCVITCDWDKLPLPDGPPNYIITH